MPDLLTRPGAPTAEQLIATLGQARPVFPAVSHGQPIFWLYP